jgi:RNA polymerase sigma-70 factor (ECF subfamily)
MSETRSGGQAEPRSLETGDLFTAYHQRVALWVRRLGGPGIEVDDAVQEVFLVAHRRLRWFRGRESLTVWFYRVTENVVRHQRRRLRRRREVFTEDQEIAEQAARAGENADDEEKRRQGLQIIYQVLDRMSDRNRTLIILFELEELSGEEIARLKGAKLATVWVWLHRARAEFRQQLAIVQQSAAASRTG